MIYGSLFLAILCIYIFGISIEKSLLRGRNYGASPLTWFVPLWLLSTLMLTLPIHKYMVSFSSESYYYIVSIHFFFMLGCLLGIVFSMHRSIVGSVREQQADASLAITILLGVGVFGVLIFSADALLTSGLSFRERLSFKSMALIKDEYSDSSRSGAFGGMIIQMGYYSYGLGQIGMIAYRFSLAQRKIVTAGNKYLCILFISLIAFNSIFVTGGRIELILNLILYLSAFMTLNSKESARGISWKKILSRVAFLFLAFAILWVGIVMLSSRVGGEQNSAYMLYIIHSAHIADAMSKLTVDYPILATLSLQLSYLTAPIPFLGKFLDYYAYGDPQIYFGALNFAPSIAPLNKFLGFVDPSFMGEAAYARTRILENSGYFGNVWATLGRELLIDFGIYGSLFFFFALGFVANSVRLQLWRRPRIDLAVFYALIRLQLLWSLAHGLFHHRTFGYAFTLAVALVLAMTLIRTVNRSQEHLTRHAAQN